MAPLVIVSGDLIRDHHLYRGERASLSTSEARGTRYLPEVGGAELVRRLLKATLGKTARVMAGTNLSASKRAPPRLAEAHAIWSPSPGADKGSEVWRLGEPLGFGGDDPPAPLAMQSGEVPDVLVLADGGHRFRQPTHAPLWHLPHGHEPPRWILLKHSTPLAKGALWDRLQPQPHPAEHTALAKRTVCLVSADDLRCEALSLSRGLSWEATLIDLRRALRDDPSARQLATCRHLLVTFGHDGALWLNNSDPNAPKATLHFEADGIEGAFAARFKGGTIGAQTVVATAVAQQLVRHTSAEDEPDLGTALEMGLLAARDLVELGHGKVGVGLPTGFPTERLAAVLKAGSPSFAKASIPWDDNDLSEEWSLATSGSRPGPTDGPFFLQLAKRVARWGPTVLDQMPYARFGKLVTAERREIEGLRHIRALMQGYAGQKTTKRPLNIGVFGPPGAGKSFGVKELTKEVFGEGSWLEFNLSQFEGPQELHGAFHRVRDMVLAGLTPVAFWDEFDSRKLHWLQYLLAPMQDGRFQAGQLIHTIGKCVFIFAGGTKKDFTDFAKRKEAEEEEFKLSKGPDFVSRLDGHYNVLGPNPPDDDETAADKDIGPPLRRALLMRGQLELKETARLQVDDGLLHALLTIPKYVNGSRSLEKLLQALHLGEGVLRRSSLPARPQLAMHVDPDEFAKALAFRRPERATPIPDDKIEAVARAIHETWRRLEMKNGKAKPPFNKSYDALKKPGRNDNRVAAQRMLDVLAIGGLGLEPGRADSVSKPPPSVAKQLKRMLEPMAEAEHDGWMKERISQGWQLGETDRKRKLHDSLRPYADLPSAEKDKDRNSIRHYPDFAAEAGYRIDWAI